MKHKTIGLLPYIFALLLTATSCIEDVIGYYEHDNDGQLQMNAIVSTADELAYVSIRRVKKYITVPENDATVEVVVNGEVRHTITGQDSMTYNGRYFFRPDFRAGDKVEFIAHVGDEELHSATECLEPLEIVSVDTTALEVNHSGFYNDDVHRLRIKIRKPKGAKRGEFYRLEVRQKMTHMSFSEQYNHYTGEWYIQDHSFSYEQRGYTYQNDVALNNGNVNTGEESLIEFMDQTPNRYGVFSDDFFDGDTYTLVVDVPRKQNWADELKCVVSTITADEYYYLRSVCYISDDNEISDGAPVLKTNVMGGMGFVGIESAATYTLSWANHYATEF